MGVVAEDGPPGGAALRRDHPVVAGGQLPPGQQFQPGHGGQRLVLVEQRGDCRVEARIGQVGAGGEGLAVVVERFQPGGALWPQVGDHAGADQFRLPVARQPKGDHLDPADGIGDGVGLRLHAQDGELDGQLPPGDGPDQRGVHPPAVGIERGVFFGIQLRDFGLGGLAHGKAAQQPVGLEGERAEQFRQRARRHASLELDLPQPVLRVDVALGDEQVAQGGGVDVRDAVTVAQHAHRGGDGRSQCAIERRQGLSQARLPACPRRRHHQRGRAQCEAQRRVQAGGQLSWSFIAGGRGRGWPVGRGAHVAGVWPLCEGGVSKVRGAEAGGAGSSGMSSSQGQ